MSVTSSRTNGFLFADLRDYTRFVEAHGDTTAARLLDAYRAVVRSVVSDYGGAEIKTEGDSFYVVFPSASSAVECGVAILRAASDKAGVDGLPIRVGIGVHAGETVETADGYVGSAVNVAARVCSQARAGELLVTDTVRALTRTRLSVRFVDRRSRRLKGIAEPVITYRVEPLDAGAAAVLPAGQRMRERMPSVSGLSRHTRVAFLLAGLLIGGAAAGYLLIAAQRPSPDLPATPTAGVTATASPQSAAEADLLLQLPASIRDTCRPTEQPAERVGSVASLRCNLPLAADADTVWYDRFDSAQALGDYFAALTQSERLQRAECGPDVPRAQGNWRVGSTHSGRLFCYTSDGSTWIVWSYDAERILARAVRRGDAADDWTDLFEWWRQVRLFVQ